MLPIILSILLLAALLIIILLVVEVERDMIEKVVKIVALVGLNIATFAILNYTTSEVIPFVLMATGYIYSVTLIMALIVKNYGVKLWISTNIFRFIGITFAASMLLLGLSINVDAHNQVLNIARRSIMIYSVYHFVSNSYKMTYEAATQISFNTRRSAKKLYGTLINRK